MHDERVIDASGAFAKYAAEVMDERLPYEVAAATVPEELGKFIEAGERAIEGAQRAVDYLTRQAGDHRGVNGEPIVDTLSGVKLHAPYAQRARIMMAGGNYVIHSAGMSFRGGEGPAPIHAGDLRAEPVPRHLGLLLLPGERRRPRRERHLPGPHRPPRLRGRGRRDPRPAWQGHRRQRRSALLLGLHAPERRQRPHERRRRRQLPVQLRPRQELRHVDLRGALHRGRRVPEPPEHRLRDAGQRPGAPARQHEGHDLLLRRVPRVHVART